MRQSLRNFSKVTVIHLKTQAASLETFKVNLFTFQSQPLLVYSIICISRWNWLSTFWLWKPFCVHSCLLSLTHEQLFADSWMSPGITGPGPPWLMLIFWWCYFITLNLHSETLILFFPLQSSLMAIWHCVNGIESWTLLHSCGLMPTFCLERAWKDLIYKKLTLNVNCDIVLSTCLLSNPGYSHRCRAEQNGIFSKSTSARILS